MFTSAVSLATSALTTCIWARTTFRRLARRLDHTSSARYMAPILVDIFVIVNATVRSRSKGASGRGDQGSVLTNAGIEAGGECKQGNNLSGFLGSSCASGTAVMIG